MDIARYYCRRRRRRAAWASSVEVAFYVFLPTRHVVYAPVLSPPRRIIDERRCLNLL